MEKDDKSELLDALFDSKSSPSEINEITEVIIGSSYKVANALGCGFLEKVYENALALEISKHGLKVDQQRAIKVFYEKTEVGFIDR